MSPTLAPVILNITMVKILRQVLALSEVPGGRSRSRKSCTSIPTVVLVAKRALPRALVTRVIGTKPDFLLRVSSYGYRKRIRQCCILSI